MKAKKLIKKQNVLILIGFTYAFTLILPQLSNAMYDPKHGRWLQRDPNGINIIQSTPSPDDLADPPNQRFIIDPTSQYEDGKNLYGYAHNNPAYLTDPHGLLGIGTGIWAVHTIANLIICSNQLDKALEDKEIKRLYEVLQNDPKCPMDIGCMCCDPAFETKGIAVRPKAEGGRATIVLCNNLVKNQGEFNKLFYHELTHRCHDCRDKWGGKDTCRSKICTEMRAVDGDCSCNGIFDYKRCIKSKALKRVRQRVQNGYDWGNCGNQSLAEQMAETIYEACMNSGRSGKCEKSCRNEPMPRWRWW
ncbi:MAG: hypothetical protein ACYTF1_20510 [Planctomycetota bacterium]|jgi:hypothetical protein